MRAYDIEMLTRGVDRADPADHGWCFGLPPGIAPEQWPLDPNNGYPLMHGFTLLLPEDYRCHGPDIVALSFFATPCDMGDGPFEHGEAIAEAFAGDSLEPDDPDLAVFWQAERRRHTRLHRMSDSLGGAFALILLTNAEYDGALCRPPTLTPNAYRDAVEAPGWLSDGAARSLWQQEFSEVLGLVAEDYALYRELGGIPDANIAYDRAIRWTPRANDPNAGLPTCDFWHESQTGYQQSYYWLDGKSGPENYREHTWARDHAALHIGGTMQPMQNVPRFSPYHIGFLESFGGYNFGGGSAQLDFKDMRLDWACG